MAGAIFLLFSSSFFPFILELMILCLPTHNFDLSILFLFVIDGGRFLVKPVLCCSDNLPTGSGKNVGTTEDI